MPKKKAKSKAGRPRIIAVKDACTTYIRHTKAEQAAWDRAAEARASKLGLGTMSRVQWLRWLANNDTAAREEMLATREILAKHNNDTAAREEMLATTSVFGVKADQGFTQPVAVVVDDPLPSTFVPPPSPIVRKGRPLQPGERGVLQSIATEGGTDSPLLKPLRRDGFVDSDGMLTDLGLEAIYG